MAVRTRVLDKARHRARIVRNEIGTDIRRSRTAAGLSLRDIGRVVGRSASWLSRVERGMVRAVRVDELIVVSAAVGLKLWLATYPAERAIHDAPQLSLLRRFRARVGELWQWSYEVLVPVAGDRRAADAVIRRTGAVIVIEAFTRFADCQAQLRAVLTKARDLRVDRIVIVVNATHANRRALAEAADILASDFPLSTRAVLAALAEGRDPGANGVVIL